MSCLSRRCQLGMPDTRLAVRCVQRFLESYGVGHWNNWDGVLDHPRVRET